MNKRKPHEKIIEWITRLTSINIFIAKWNFPKKKMNWKLKIEKQKPKESMTYGHFEYNM